MTAREVASEIIWGPHWRDRLLNLSGTEVKTLIQAVAEIIEVTRETEIGGALALVLGCHEQGASRLQKDLIRTAMVAEFRLALDEAQETVSQPTH